jgi:hypothetical protein
MNQKKIYIGDWVEFYHKTTNLDLVGFVLAIGRFEVKIYVPLKEKVFIIPIIKVQSRENVELDQQDLQTLINFALDKRDFV